MNRNRREFMAEIAGTAAALTAARWIEGAEGPVPAGSRRRKPNIVLIMADDLGAEALGCYGGTTCKTPALDELARTGLRFDNCYATPLCVPSRMQLMTGQYPCRTGVVANGGGFNPRKDVCFAQLLKRSGYATCIVSKWHLSGDFADRPQILAESGFDEHYMWRLRKKGGRGVLSGYWDAEMWKDGQAIDDGKGKYAPDLYCDYLIDFMKRHRNQPFLAYWPMHIPHDETWHGRTCPATPDTICKYGAEGKTGKNVPKQAGMVDMIQYMDKLVGRLVGALGRLGLRERTLVLFTGDNGTTRGVEMEVGGRTVSGGKKTLTEEGCRVPLIANWPGTTPGGKVADDLVDFTDFLPALAELGGAAVPKDRPIDGRSFLPQVRGLKGKPREWVYCQLGRDWFVRDHRWRLSSQGELHDMTDRYAPKPAAGSPEAGRARKRLAQVVERLHASCPEMPKKGKRKR